MLRKLGLWRDANSDKLLATPTSSPSHSNKNVTDSRENSPKKNGNGSAATESTAIESHRGGIDVSVSNYQITIKYIFVKIILLIFSQKILMLRWESMTEKHPLSRR